MGPEGIQEKVDELSRYGARRHTRVLPHTKIFAGSKLTGQELVSASARQRQCPVLASAQVPHQDLRLLRVVFGDKFRVQLEVLQGILQLQALPMGCRAHFRQGASPVLVAAPSYLLCMRVTPVARHAGLSLGSNGGRACHHNPHQSA